MSLRHESRDLFRGDPRIWSPTRIRAAAELAQLAYSTENAWRNSCYRAGWRQAEFVDVGPTEVGVAATDEGIAIVPRGTNSWLDVLGDLASVIRVPWALYIDGAIGFGFKRHAARAVRGLRRVAAHYQAHGQKVWILGHSLAGAMCGPLRAVLEKEHFHVEGVIMFEAPRVGGAKFAGWADLQWEATTWRIVRVLDGVPSLIPRVPWKRMGFEDFGRLVLFVDDEVPFEDHGERRWDSLRERNRVGLRKGSQVLLRLRTAASAHDMNDLVSQANRLRELA